MAGRGNNNNDGWLALHEVGRSVELPVQFWDKVDLGFEARLGQVNEWTIPLPDELIKAVREALKVDSPDQAETGRDGCSRQWITGDRMDVATHS